MAKKEGNKYKRTEEKQTERQNDKKQRDREKPQILEDSISQKLLPKNGKEREK